jgi:AraC family L-rhamnose operon regulatory protein RhaS
MELITKGHKYHIDISLPFILIKNKTINEIKKINERYKLILINRGKFIASINNKNFLIKEQSIIFLNEKDIMVINEAENIDYYIIYFHPGIINARFNFTNVYNPDKSFNETDGLDLYVLGPFVSNAGLNFFHLSQLVYKKIEKYFLSIYDMLNFQKDKFWPCKSRSYMIELLFILRSLFNEKDSYKNFEIDDVNDDISKVIIYIHLNYDKKITIEGLAKVFYTNRTTVSNKFKEKTGLSIIEYINKLRIDIACQMLRDTNCIIEDIAERTGFSDISNFGRTFKKYTGLNPTKYKNQFDTMKYC